MDSPTQNQYRPDCVSPPGETLMETLETIGMTQAELAERTGRPLKTINEIINGKTAITPETALQLERALGIPARFWSNRERHYREFLARAKEQERLQSEVEWLKQVPLQDMIKLRWVQTFDNAADQLREVLQFFGVVSPEQWRELWWNPRAAFRQSPAFQADPGAVAAWLRKGEVEAQQIECAPYDAARFRESLGQIRALTVELPETFQPQVIDLCAEAGVAAVFVPELPRIRASGATRWLTPNKALLQLCLRYKTDDQLWFTFFHEAGHILLHGKRDAFIEEEGTKDEKEQEADRFAADWLIPSGEWRRIAGRPRYSKQEIIAFAAEVGVAPGIVVGRLQHEGYLPYTHCNGLRRRLRWTNR